MEKYSLEFYEGKWLVWETIGVSDGENDPCYHKELIFSEDKNLCELLIEWQNKNIKIIKSPLLR